MNLKGYLEKIKIFSFKEKLMIFKYSFGSVLVESIPKSLRFFYHFSQDINNKNIQLKSEKENVLFDYPINNSSLTFCLKRNSSDAYVFDQIVIKEEYKRVKELAEQNNIKIESIVDAGANIGLTTLYLKSFYPESIVVLLEPESSTFKRLIKNLEINSLKNVHPLEKGLWFEEDKLSVDRTFRDNEDWSVRLVKSKLSSNSIETTTLLSLIKEYNFHTIDLLKIDIEGAEKQLFISDSNPQKWLTSVKIIAVEIHDETGARTDIENILRHNGFELTHSGELTIGINKKYLE